MNKEQDREETINDIANMADNRAIRKCCITEYDEKIAKGYDDKKSYQFAMGLLKIMNEQNNITNVETSYFDEEEEW